MNICNDPLVGADAGADVVTLGGFAHDNLLRFSVTLTVGLILRIVD